MILQDQHLQQALKNAPDRDMAPSEAARAAVLSYANQAVKPKQVTWKERISDWINVWFGSNWHSVGLGSAVATILIVVVVWHQQPEDTIWRAATPSEESKIDETENVKPSLVQSAPEATSDTTPQGAAAEQRSSISAAKNKAVADEAASKESPQNEPSGKSTSSRPMRYESDESVASSEQAKSTISGLAEAIPQAAPVVAEPEVPVAAAPAPVAQDKAISSPSAAIASASDGDVKPTIKGELTKESQAEGDASSKMRRENILAKKSAAKPDALGASAPKVVAKPQENQIFLMRIKNEGGNVLANQDIQVGNLRLLKLELQTKDLETPNCAALTSKVIGVDKLTGYKIESHESCDATALLLNEVEAYNQTMLNWHQNHPR